LAHLQQCAEYIFALVILMKCIGEFFVGGTAGEIKSSGQKGPLHTSRRFAALGWTAEAAVPTQTSREHVADAADLGAYGF